MNEQLVITTLKDGYAIVRINRHEKRNAMSRDTRRALRESIDALRGKVKVVILTGTETSFCAGIDLKERNAERAAGTLVKDSYSDWEEVVLAVRQHPAVFIAAVNGVALGGGSTLINVCDLAVAADDASIGMPELGFGSYPALAAPAMQMALTRKRAAYMVLTTKRIDGPTALAWGLVNQSVPRGELMEAAEELAQHVSQFDQVTLEQSKQAMDYVPNVITDWRQCFEYGAKVNSVIRANSGARAAALAKFAAGERNPGQGRQ